MSLDPQQIHAERYLRIAEIIRRETESITQLWWRRSRADQARELPAADEGAVKRVRSFLRSLSHELASTDNTAARAQWPAIRLGELRWEQGVDISQVVRDYQTLRLVVLDQLDRELDTPLTRDELMALSLNIDEAVDAAVSAFSEQEASARDEQQRELERSNRELQRFAHVVAHELKSPLSAQSLAVHLIKLRLGADLRDDDVSHALDAIRNSVDQMERLINELLRYAEIESEDAEPQPTDCREVVAQAVRNLEPDIVRSRAEVNCADLPTVLASPTAILLLFQNLIGNAIHYRGEDAPRIHVAADLMENGWQFSVADNGVGIDREDAKRIFDMFARAHAELRPRGTGIGLAMCRRIVQNLGGRIWVESQPGKGSRFFFILPANGEGAGLSQPDSQTVPA